MASEAKKKQWYMKDEFFNKAEYGIKGITDKTPTEVVKAVDYKILHVGNVTCTFTKGVPLADNEVKLFNEAQKKFYLIER